MEHLEKAAKAVLEVHKLVRAMGKIVILALIDLELGVKMAYTARSSRKSPAPLR